MTFIESPKLLRVLEALAALKSLEAVLYIQTNSLDRGIGQHCQNVESLGLILTKTQALISTIKLTKNEI